MPSSCSLNRFPEIELYPAKIPPIFAGASFLTWPRFQPTLLEADAGSGDHLEAATRRTRRLPHLQPSRSSTRRQPPDLRFSRDPGRRASTSADDVRCAGTRRRRSIFPHGRESLTKFGYLAGLPRQSAYSGPGFYLAPCLQSRVRDEAKIDGVFSDSRIQSPHFLHGERRRSVRQKLYTPVYAPFLAVRRLAWLWT